MKSEQIILCALIVVCCAVFFGWTAPKTIEAAETCVGTRVKSCPSSCSASGSYLEAYMPAVSGYDCASVNTKGACGDCDYPSAYNVSGTCPDE